MSCKFFKRCKKKDFKLLKIEIQNTLGNVKLVLSSFLEANDLNNSDDPIEFSNKNLEGIIKYLNRISGKNPESPSYLDIKTYSEFQEMDFLISINDCVVDKINVELVDDEDDEKHSNYDTYFYIRIRKALLNSKSDEFKSLDNIFNNFQGEHIKLLKELF